MTKNKKWFWVGFCAVLFVGFAVAVVLKDKSGADDGGMSAASLAPNAPDDSGGVDAADTISSSSDDLSMLPSSDDGAVGNADGDANSDGGDKTVENKAGGYSFTIPPNWYVEEDSTAKATIYPDYDPSAAATAPAQCKIEISTFAAASPSAGLDSWITSNLHADPTVDVSEILRTPISIGGVAGIEWQGTLNGIETTLGYVLVNGTIFEIAPSTLSSAGDATNDDCDLVFQALLSKLNFQP